MKYSHMLTSNFFALGVVTVMALVCLPTDVFANASDNQKSIAYSTKLPPAALLEYRLRRGRWSGSGELRWQPVGVRYQAQLQGHVAGFKVLTWTSEGGLGEAGIAPQRFTDQRRGKAARVAQFQSASAHIVYSEGQPAALWMPDAQDRLSWMLQLSAIALADPHRLDKGQRIGFLVSGARGDADVWSFESQGLSALSTPAGNLSAVKLVREPRKLNDTRVEVWLDPARHYLPIQARMADTADATDALELTLTELTLL
jgi:hypothetical protein